MEQYTIVKNVRDNEALRASFDKLAQDTFGLTFEDWYQNGFWREKYIPYSMVKDGEVVANVSVNTIDMMLKGETKHVLQLGTVMTKEAYRNQGLIRKIMEEIDKDFDGKVDGTYLFAGADVVNFYPKFGFHKAKEYQYTKEVNQTGDRTMVQVPMKEKEAWGKLEAAICENKFRGQFDMVNYSELYMFYVSKFMQDDVYYDEALGTYAIAEIDGGNLFLHAVISGKDVALENVIEAFGSSIKQVTLGFVPMDTAGFACTELKDEDTNLFVKGNCFEKFDVCRVMFPTLSHA